MATGILLRDAVDEYLRALARSGVAPGTVKQYRAHVNRLERRFPTRRFASLTTADLDDFLHGEDGISNGMMPGTQSMHRAALRSFFRYGVKRRWSKYALEVPMPMAKAKRPAGRSATPPTRLNAGQLLLMLDASSDDPVLRGMVAVAMNTALRISDVLKLKVGDIDLLLGGIRVDTQKTGLYDELPVTLDLDVDLRRYLTWYAENITESIQPAMVLFPGLVQIAVSSDGIPDYRHQDTGRAVSYHTARGRLHDLFKKCGIIVEEREAWHVIRRSVARIYFDQMREDISFDHALRQTAALLGHQNVATTQRYLGLSTEIAARNESLRGKPFLTAVGRQENVVPLTARG